jgi:hypothetical protein
MFSAKGDQLTFATEPSTIACFSFFLSSSETKHLSTVQQLLCYYQELISLMQIPKQK